VTEKRRNIVQSLWTDIDKIQIQHTNLRPQQRNGAASLKKRHDFAASTILLGQNQNLLRLGIVGSIAWNPRKIETWSMAE
jgi:hypothetical protein